MAAPTFKGLQTLIWGTGNSNGALGPTFAVAYGYAESYDIDRAGGENKKFGDTEGQTISKAYYNETHTANITFLAVSGVTLPSRGTAVTLNGEYPHFIETVKETGKNDDGVRFQITTEWTAGITTG